MQNINSKVSNLVTHVVNTSFNINKPDTCVKQPGVQCKNVGKLCENVKKLSSNCPVKCKMLNVGSCNISNVNYGSSNKYDPKFCHYVKVTINCKRIVFLRMKIDLLVCSKCQTTILGPYCLTVQLSVKIMPKMSMKSVHTMWCPKVVILGFPY